MSQAPCFVHFRLHARTITHWVATDRFDLTAEQIASIYQLRWTIESFFGWWKRHLHEEHNEQVSIQRVRELRNTLRNEAAENAAVGLGSPNFMDFDLRFSATS